MSTFPLISNVTAFFFFLFFFFCQIEDFIDMPLGQNYKWYNQTQRYKLLYIKSNTWDKIYKILGATHPIKKLSNRYSFLSERITIVFWKLQANPLTIWKIAGFSSTLLKTSELRKSQDHITNAHTFWQKKKKKKNFPVSSYCIAPPFCKRTLWSWSVWG